MFDLFEPGPFHDGYYAGLVNDERNPNSILSPSWLPWVLGNRVGRALHCATVEAVYLNSPHD